MARRERLALVTGANRGIGRKVARQVAQDNDLRVLIGACDPAKGRAADRELGAKAVALQLDVADPASVRAAFVEVNASHGYLDVLIDNAGIDYDTNQKSVCPSPLELGHWIGRESGIWDGEEASCRRGRAEAAA